ncbi:MAG TPA: alcohol dehydrogenase [Myxococcales bacterium]|nr:alcohol dehydrogenase [Myxococcales bacterium]
MKAAIIRAHGDLDAVQIEEIEAPVAGPNEALVQVRACALNHMDLWARKGIPGFNFPLPLIPGCDISGTVVSAPNLEPGTEVVIQPGVSCGDCADCIGQNDHLCSKFGILGETQNGGCAEFVTVPADNLVVKPQNLSFAEAAAYPLTFLTAWHMVVTRCRIKEGEWILVHAAGSGVGSAAVQIARLHGARIIATAGSEEKCQRARELGAELAINYRDDSQWPRTLYKYTQKRGVDIVFEHVGAATFEGSIRSLTPGGRLVTCGATTGGEVTLNLQRLFIKNLSILGSTMGTKAELHTITKHVAKGELVPMVDRILPLAQIHEAHRALEAREAFGKIVVTP